MVRLMANLCWNEGPRPGRRLDALPALREHAQYLLETVVEYPGDYRTQNQKRAGCDKQRSRHPIDRSLLPIGLFGQLVELALQAANPALKFEYRRQ